MKENTLCRTLMPFISIRKVSNAAQKVFLIMKLATIILFLINLQVSAVTYAQNVSISRAKISIKDAFAEIREQTGYYFIYNHELVSELKPVSLKVHNVSVETALNELLKGQPLEYSIENKIITIRQKRTQESRNPVIQNRKISGTVTDAEDKMPLIGVSVKVKGGTAAAITDLEGRFSLNIASNNVILVFSYIGYATKEVPVTDADVYNISLRSETEQLQEVVVAFGKSNKRELTNAVSQVTSKDIEQRPISNLNSALVGVAPGVQTTAGSGQPGEGPVVVLRGFTSVTGSNSPLYVLDGAPFEGEISNINPDDIESISMLKDAASTALYGARAANGIVLITTKRGKRNTNTATFSASTALSERGLPEYEKVDAYQYFPLVWESLTNGALGNPRDATLSLKDELGWNPFNVADDEIVTFDGKINPNARLLYPEDLGVKNAMQRTGIRNDVTLSLSGGAEKSDYYISLNGLDDKGYVASSDFQRVSGKVNVNAQPVEWLTTGLNLYGNYSKTERANENSGINENPFYVDLIMAPIYPVYKHDPLTGAYLLDENGYRQYDPGDYRPLMTGRNVVAETKYNINNYRRNSLMANGNVGITFLKDFKIASTISATINNYRSLTFDNTQMGDAYGAGRTTRANNSTYSYNFNQLLTYQKTLGRHSVSLLAGHENYMNYYDPISVSKRGMAILDNDPTLSNFSVIMPVTGDDRYYTTEGYLSKLDYNFDGRYFISGSYRRDGSSRFKEGSKWGDFWSVSGAWNIDREAFFNIDWVDFLKLRGSYGLVGNDDANTYFAYQGLYTLNYNNGVEPGAIFTKIPSPDLVWETNRNADIALEFETLKSRLNGSVEVFNRQSDNLLFQINVPVTAGVLTQLVNFGSMRNRGIEVQLNGDIIRKRDFKWNMGINWSTLDNKILSLPASYEGRITGNHIYSTGRSIYEFWVREFYGIDPDTGLELYYAADPLNSSGRVFKGTDTLTTSGATDNVRFHYAGSAIPDFYGSFNNVLSYKKFSLQLMFLYQAGGRIFDSDYQTLMHRGTIGRSLHVDALRRWQKPGDITDVPKRSTGTTLYSNDRFITNASYLNLRVAALTYMLPEKFLSRYKMKTARLFVNGENLFITSARKGMDPTQTYQGQPSYTYAPSRIVSFGINVTL